MVSPKEQKVKAKQTLWKGYIEINSGPLSSSELLKVRLSRLCLRTLDFGGAGNCFFFLRAVSHQLYGTPKP